MEQGKGVPVSVPNATRSILADAENKVRSELALLYTAVREKESELYGITKAQRAIGQRVSA